MALRRTKILLVMTLVLPVIVASCASTPTRFFTLAPISGSPAVRPYSGPAVRVNVVHMPASLNRIEITNELSSGEVSIDDLSHWAAPLDQLVRQTLTLDLMSRLPEGRVIPAHLANSQGTLGVNIDILAFSADARGARLRATWNTTPDDSRQGSAVFSVLLQDDMPVSGASGTAQALSAMLARLADRISADIVSGEMRAPPQDR